MNGSNRHQTDDPTGRTPATGNETGRGSVTDGRAAPDPAHGVKGQQTGGRTGNPQPGLSPEHAPGGQSEPGAERVDGTVATEDETTALRREIQELRDRNLRLLAEVQNSAKRAERDKQEALRYAEADFAKDLLPVLDDLERTLEAARTASDAKSIAEGVRILHEHLLKVLRARHIVPIEAAGQPFDPAHHEALLQQPSDEHPAGTVTQEVARGYKMHERVLRPTRAIISSGPGAPGAAPESGGTGKARGRQDR